MSGTRMPSAQHPAPRAPKQRLASVTVGERPNTRNLHINIQRLTLTGYTPAQQQRFVLTLESTFKQLAANQTHWPSAPLIRLANMDAGRLRTGATPEDAARQLAMKLFGTLTPSQRERNDV